MLWTCKLFRRCVVARAFFLTTLDFKKVINVFRYTQWQRCPHCSSSLLCWAYYSWTSLSFVYKEFIFNSCYPPMDNATETRSLGLSSSSRVSLKLVFNCSLPCNAYGKHCICIPRTYNMANIYRTHRPSDSLGISACPNSQHCLCRVYTWKTFFQLDWTSDYLHSCFASMDNAIETRSLRLLISIIIELYPK